MHNLVLAILFILSGFFMKYSDDLFDIDKNRNTAIIYGVLCAIVSVWATISNVDAAYIFIAILIGNLLAFKVDGIHHIVTLVVFAIFCFIFGIPEINLAILLVCIFSALLDEVGHEMIAKISDNTYLNLFFEYRFVMKVVILLLAITGVFSLWTFVFFIFFEISYEFAGVFRQFN